MVCLINSSGLVFPNFPVVSDVTTGNDAGVASLNHTVVLPGSIVAGQRLIVLFSSENPTTTFPAGWTELFDGGVNFQSNISGAYRDADGSEGASINVVTGVSLAGSWAVIRLAADTFDSATAPQVGTIATGNSVSPNCPSITPAWGALNTLFIAAICVKQTVTPKTISAWPTGYADNQTSVSVASTAELFLTTRRLNAVSDDPSAFTISSSDQWASQTLAIRPPL